jgi:antitoxin ParD1/3/4
MATRETMNVSLSPELKAFIKDLVASGRYRNDSEVVRDGLRMLQERERWRRLEEELLEGLQGPLEEVDEAWWRNMHEQLEARIRQRETARRPKRA